MSENMTPEELFQQKLGFSRRGPTHGPIALAAVDDELRHLESDQFASVVLKLKVLDDFPRRYVLAVLKECKERGVSDIPTLGEYEWLKHLGCGKRFVKMLRELGKVKRSFPKKRKAKKA